jgi:tetratricopeptide (TPR) repeat protein
MTQEEPTPSPPVTRRKLAALIGGLAAITFLVYAPAASFDFVNYDDHQYVVENPYIQQGLTTASIKWALTTGYFSYWHPVTWLSYLGLVSLVGVAPGPMHLANAAIHSASAGLMFYLLWRMTGWTWRSAVAAAFFAWHPLRVESVAWISELKDVLATLFWLLTTLAYVRYTERPKQSRYIAVLACYLLGLASKPTLVTLPATLLLLDYWPLQRTRWLRRSDSKPPTPIGWLLLEKVPMLVMAGAIAFMAVAVQAANYAMGGPMPLTLRLQNALVAVSRYLGKLAWPAELAVFYPHPGLIVGGGISVGTTVLAAAVFVTISAIAVLQARGRQYLLVGWLFFLGTLLPVSGIIQAGAQAMADRYSYVPTMFLIVAVVWLTADVMQGRPSTRAFFRGLAAVALIACVVTTSVQLRHWRDTEALFSHALNVTSDNYIALASIGYDRYQRGDIDGAMEYYRAAHKVRPTDPLAAGNMGKALQAQGKRSEAEAAYRFALRYSPPDAGLHNNLANLLAERGKTDEAIQHHDAAIRIEPAMAEAHYNYGLTLARVGRAAEAQARLERVLQLRPDHPDARYAYALVMAERGYHEAAIAQLLEAIRLRPNWAEAERQLAWLLAISPDDRIRNGARAVAVAEHLNQITHYDDAAALDTLATAYAAAGRFDSAIATATKAREVAETRQQPELVRQINQRLDLFNAGKSYLQPTTRPATE